MYILKFIFICVFSVSYMYLDKKKYLLELLWLFGPKAGEGHKNNLKIWRFATLFSKIVPK